MYDIEEQVLKHPDVAEAEVIKFAVDGEEFPAMVVVLNSNSTNRLAEITKDLCSIDVAGMEHLIGVRFVDKFKTHPVTSKRDYLSLQEDKSGYFFVDEQNNIFVTDIGDAKQKIDRANIKIFNV
jgi:non-ribosomal peptide synthetase component E (peptide arylation enzyme)